MKPTTLLLAGLAAALSLAAAAEALAVHPHHGYHATRADRIARYNAANRPWHGDYAYTPYGTPIALVVPPNAKMHTSYAWGVSQSEMVPLYHQFFRDYPGELGAGYGRQFRPTPYWPSHTDQFGVYPVRGPW
ncbi:MAG: hypothetical protein MUF06_08735 [Pirellulaceae bacterium]|nr:hypothetical protein [Pirellulaceae bacterium]